MGEVWLALASLGAALFSILVAEAFIRVWRDGPAAIRERRLRIFATRRAEEE